MAILHTVRIKLLTDFSANRYRIKSSNSPGLRQQSHGATENRLCRRPSPISPKLTNLERHQPEPPQNGRACGSSMRVLRHARRPAPVRAAIQRVWDCLRAQARQPALTTRRLSRSDFAPSLAHDQPAHAPDEATTSVHDKTQLARLAPARCALALS